MELFILNDGESTKRFSEELETKKVRKRNILPIHVNFMRNYLSSSKRKMKNNNKRKMRKIVRNETVMYPPPKENGREEIIQTAYTEAEKESYPLTNQEYEDMEMNVSKLSMKGTLPSLYPPLPFDIIYSNPGKLEYRLPLRPSQNSKNNLTSPLRKRSMSSNPLISSVLLKNRSNFTSNESKIDPSHIQDIINNCLNELNSFLPFDDVNTPPATMIKKSIKTLRKINKLMPLKIQKPFANGIQILISHIYNKDEEGKNDIDDEEKDCNTYPASQNNNGIIINMNKRNSYCDLSSNEEEDGLGFSDNNSETFDNHSFHSSHDDSISAKSCSSSDESETIYNTRKYINKENEEHDANFERKDNKNYNDYDYDEEEEAELINILVAQKEVERDLIIRQKDKANSTLQDKKDDNDFLKKKLMIIKKESKTKFIEMKEKEEMVKYLKQDLNEVMNERNYAILKNIEGENTKSVLDDQIKTSINELEIWKIKNDEINNLLYFNESRLSQLQKEINLNLVSSSVVFNEIKKLQISKKNLEKFKEINGDLLYRHSHDLERETALHEGIKRLKSEYYNIKEEEVYFERCYTPMASDEINKLIVDIPEIIDLQKRYKEGKKKRHTEKNDEKSKNENKAKNYEPINKDMEITLTQWTAMQLVLLLEKNLFEASITKELENIKNEIAEKEKELLLLVKQLEEQKKKENLKHNTINNTNSSNINENSIIITINALGDGTDIPLYLRHEGVLKLKNISKAEGEKMVKQVWQFKSQFGNDFKKSLKDKDTTITSPISISSMTMKDYLYEFLKSKFSYQNIIAEWGYSLVRCLGNNLYDADVELFFLCLYDCISMDVYTDQMAMIDSLKFLCIQIDLQSNGTEKATGVILKNDLIRTLRNFFPYKSDDDYYSMINMLSIDYPNEKIPHESIFVENNVGNQGQFIELIRDQHVREIQIYFMSLSKKIASRDPLEKNEVLLMDVREAFYEVDPIISEEQLNKYIKLGLGSSQIDFESTIDYTLFLKRLRKYLVKPTLNYDKNAKVEYSSMKNKLSKKMSTTKFFSRKESKLSVNTNITNSPSSIVEESPTFSFVKKDFVFRSERNSLRQGPKSIIIDTINEKMENFYSEEVNFLLNENNNSPTLSPKESPKTSPKLLKKASSPVLLQSRTLSSVKRKSSFREDMDTMLKRNLNMRGKRKSTLLFNNNINNFINNVENNDEDRANFNVEEELTIGNNKLLEFDKKGGLTSLLGFEPLSDNDKSFDEREASVLELKEEEGKIANKLGILKSVFKSSLDLKSQESNNEDLWNQLGIISEEEDVNEKNNSRSKSSRFPRNKSLKISVNNNNNNNSIHVINNIDSNIINNNYNKRRTQKRRSSFNIDGLIMVDDDENNY